MNKFKIAVLALCTSLILSIFFIVFISTTQTPEFTIPKSMIDSNTCYYSIPRQSLVSPTSSFPEDVCARLRTINDACKRYCSELALFYEIKDKNEKLSLKLCKSIMHISVKDACFYLLAKRDLNYAICNFIENEEFKKSCLFYFAEKFRNPDLCEQLKESIYKYRCYTDFVEKFGDSSLCNRIEDLTYRDRCYQFCAYEMLDFSCCKKISSITEKAECYYRVFSRSKISESIHSIGNCRRYLDNDPFMLTTCVNYVTSRIAGSCRALIHNAEISMYVKKLINF